MAPFPPDIERLVNHVYPIARQQMAIELASAGRRVYWFDICLELVLLGVFYFSGAAAQLRNALERRVRRPFVLAAIYVVLLMAGLSVALLPTTFYGSFVLAHRYGLSSESVARWLRDWAVSAALGALIAAPVGAFFLRLIARFRAWPAIAALVAGPLIFFGSAVYPLWIAPLFNLFAPLPPSPLTRSILDLAKQQGLSATVVYEYDMSTQTNEADAYVAGLGKSERIAVGDTLLRGMRPDEVLYVMAHEIGHYKLGHLWRGSFEAWAGAALAVAWIAVAGAWATRRFPGRSRTLGDPAAVPLIGVLFILFQAATAPGANALSRDIEHAADTFAAEHTDLGDAGVRTFARLANQDLSVLHPSRLNVWYFYTHPPTDERILFAAHEQAAKHPQAAGPQKR